MSFPSTTAAAGGGYSLTVLGLLNPERIARIWASDIDPEMLKVAGKNLSLLTPAGMAARLDQLKGLYEQFQKPAHLEAIQSAGRLMGRVRENIELRVFQADVMAGLSLDGPPDIVITDLPYGQMVDWSGGQGDLNRFMDSLAAVSGPETVIAVCMNKAQKIAYPGARRLDRETVGKRKFEIYVPLNLD